MCKIYNKIGSLSTLKYELEKNDIDNFKSIREIIDFQKSYIMRRQQLISKHENMIAAEKEMLIKDIKDFKSKIQEQKLRSEQQMLGELEELKWKLGNLANHIPRNFLQNIFALIKRLKYQRMIKYKETNFVTNVEKSVSGLLEIHQIKSVRYQFITSQFKQAVEQSASSSLTELERKKTILDRLNSYVYGAVGEQKVVNTLKALSDDYILINDFRALFRRAIYSSRDKDYIKSVQIDHILIAPSGVFLIETKNWGKQSLENLNLFSPVEQIRRANFVLYKLLNHESRDRTINLDKHHWGDRKIAIRNIMVLINEKPKEEFQYVKTLTLSELLSYIKYFPPIYSTDETENIAQYLIDINAKEL